MPSIGRGKGNPSSDALKGSWERISLPPLPRSSHTVDVVAGTAYIFGGDGRVRQPVDNDVYAVVLPQGFAGADCYAIKPKPAPQSVDHAPQEEGVAAPSSSGKDKGLTEIPLGDAPNVPVIREPSPAGRAPAPPKQEEESSEDEETSSEEEDSDSDEEGDAPASARKDKGKGPAPPSVASHKVPPPRVGHASAVIGSRVLVFGGRQPGPDPQTAPPLEEHGRVWAFDTRTHTWASLDPRPATLPAPLTLAPAASPQPFPAARSGHCCVATDRPGQPGNGTNRKKMRGANKAAGWREWAEGDRAEVGIPQAPVVGNIAAHATDDESDGYGTLFVHGGRLADGSLSTEAWAFDVHTRVWQQLPDAPGPGRQGSAVCISKSRLYRFGGADAAGQPQGGRIDFLELGLDTFDDVSALGDEVNVTARGGGWKTLAEEAPGVSVADEGEGATKSLVDQHPWPGARTTHGLCAVTTGGGREYLLLILGEGGEGQCWDDVWAFQVPSLGGSMASVTDAVLTVFRRKTGEGRWYRVETGAYDEDDPSAAEGPGPRGCIATSYDHDENAVVVWGGMAPGGKRQGDGWILRLGDRPRG